MTGVDVLDTPQAGGLVVRGGMLRVLGFGAGIVLSLGGVVLLTRHLGRVDYGRFQTVISLTMIVAAVTDGGMMTLGVREYAQRVGADRERFMRTLLGLRIVLTSLGVCMAVAIAALGDYGSAMVAGTLLAGIGLVILIVQTMFQIPLAVELRLGTITAIDVARQAMATAAIVALVLAGAGLVPLLASTIPVHLVILVWTALLVRGRIPVRASFRAAQALRLLKPTATFTLATAVGMIYLYAAQVITSLVATGDETGLFSAGFRVFIVLAAVPGLLVSSAFPLLARAARDDHVRLGNVVRGLFAGVLVLGGAAAVGCVLGAEPVIAVVAGSKFDAAADVLQIQGIALMATFVISVWGAALLALHRHRAVVVCNLIAFVVSATTVSILASSHGANGAAVGTVLGELALALTYGVALGRAGSNLLPRIGTVLRVAVALAAALAVWLVPGLPPLADVSIGLLVYLVVALAVGAVPDDVLAQLRRGEA